MRYSRHRRSWLLVWALAALPILIWVGCSEEPGTPTGPQNPGFAECGDATIFRPRDFSNPTVIDNRFFPLAPGKQFILDGTANRGGGTLAHRVVFTVTDLTKEIDGVRSVVMWDRDYNNGVLVEAELAFFAQDDDGAIWTMGEYPEEYFEGEFLGAPSVWISGRKGSEAGILVTENAPVGTKFLQGWAPDVNFLDCAYVYQEGQTACVPFNCYENVLVIDERSPYEVGSGHQRKYYAPGVGVVLVGAVNDPEGEKLELINILDLNEQEMADARAAALKLEARAYKVSDAYRRTKPMQ